MLTRISLPLLLLAAFSLPHSSNACINIYAVDSSGQSHFITHRFFSNISFNQKVIAERLKGLQVQFGKKNYSKENISDYGAYLLMAGKTEEGLTLFRALSTKYPDVYAINANTAVAYELAGNIDSAYYWEKRAIAIDPKAHQQSEWLHLKILEAKLQLAKDPDWCLANTVTNIDELFDKEPANRDEFLEAFGHQLSERLPFTYGEDRAFGKMLYEFGNAYQTASIYRSYYCYAMAKHFYPALATVTDPKMQRIQQVYAKIKNSGSGSGDDLERLPPEDKKVKKFIAELINRPAIKNPKLTSVPVEELLAHI